MLMQMVWPRRESSAHARGEAASRIVDGMSVFIVLNQPLAGTH